MGMLPVLCASSAATKPPAIGSGLPPPPRPINALSAGCDGSYSPHCLHHPKALPQALAPPTMEAAACIASPGNVVADVVRGIHPAVVT
jgi:hypothetical protein